MGVCGADSLVEPFKRTVELSVLQLLKSFYKIAFGSRGDDQFVAARQDMVAYHSAERQHLLESVYQGIFVLALYYGSLLLFCFG